MVWKRIVCAGLLVAASTSTVSADWDSFWHSFHLDYQRNKAWPHPFREMAAAQARAPFEIQRMNGWRLNNTISHELFREGDGALSYAGQQQLVHISTQVPPEFRTVFVVRGASVAETEARVASVRASLARMTPEGAAVPEVQIIDRAPATGSGAIASAVNRAWLKALPDPKLPSAGSSSISGN